MRILAFSGWSQRADALASILPMDAQAFDYGAYRSYNACKDALKTYEPEVVVGWSLGGQVALRAISDGIIKPKKVILLSAHYQALKTDDFPESFPFDVLDGLRSAYSTQPEGMLKDFYLTCAFGDSEQRKVVAGMQEGKASFEEHHWLEWFDELTAFSCDSLDFAKIPPATLIYGEADCIVPVAQARHFAEKLHRAEVHILPNCAHAPHLHAPEAVRKLIASVC